MGVRVWYKSLTCFICLPRSGAEIQGVKACHKSPTRSLRLPRCEIDGVRVCNKYLTLTTPRLWAETERVSECHTSPHSLCSSREWVPRRRLKWGHATSLGVYPDEATHLLPSVPIGSWVEWGSPFHPPGLEVYWKHSTSGLAEGKLYWQLWRMQALLLHVLCFMASSDCAVMQVSWEMCSL